MRVHFEAIVITLLVRKLRWGLELLALSTQEPSSFQLRETAILSKRDFIPIRERDLLQPKYEALSSSSQSEGEAAKRRQTRQRTSHSSRTMVCWMPSCLMQLGEQDLMLELNLVIRVDKIQSKSLEDWNQDCEKLM
jgi:hypothetical protein